MSFRLHASGTTNRDELFVYDRNGLDLGDIYDAVGALDSIRSSPSAARVFEGGVGDGFRSLAIDHARDRLSTTSPHQQAVEAQGQFIGAHLMSTSIDLLLASHAPLNLHISVRNGGWGGNVRITLEQDESNAGATLLRALTPVLSEADMNGFGVLSALGRTFDAYANVAGRGADGLHRLLIQIDS
jgi:hypothetical protein